MALPKDYVFGRNLGIDVVEVKDVVDEHYPVFEHSSTWGTTFQQVVLLRQGHGFAVQSRVLGQLCQFVGRLGWLATNLEL